MLLALLWINWVLALTIFCILKAYCILDCSFSLPSLYLGMGMHAIFVWFVLEISTHTVSSRGSYPCSSFNHKCTSENVLLWMISSAPAGVSSRGKNVFCNVESSDSRVALRVCSKLCSGRLFLSPPPITCKCINAFAGCYSPFFYFSSYINQIVFTFLVDWLHLAMRN